MRVIRMRAARGGTATPAGGLTRSLNVRGVPSLRIRRGRHAVWRLRRSAFPPEEEEGDGSGEDQRNPAFGPVEQPEWVRDLYQQAEDFPEEEYLRDLLDETGGDPAKIEANARRRLAKDVGQASKPPPGGTASPPADAARMSVLFDEVDTFNLWVWLEFYSEPSEPEREMLSSVLDAWFVLGRLGSFNTANLQLSNSFEHSASHFAYDESALDSSLPATFHEMEEPEFSGRSCRFWCNLGTCDEIAIDLLLNALHNFSCEYVGIRRVQVGGAGLAAEDALGGVWRAPTRPGPFGREREEMDGIAESIRDDLGAIFGEGMEPRGEFQ